MGSYPRILQRGAITKDVIDISYDEVHSLGYLLTFELKFLPPFLNKI